MKPQAIFFDLDGTLLDSVPTLYKTYLDFLDRNGVEGSPEEFEAFDGPTLAELVETLRQRYCLPDGPLLEQYLDLVRKNYSESKLFPDALEVLDELSREGVSIHLVTSSPRDLSAPVVDSRGIASYLSSSHFGDSVRRSKPDPEIYRRAIEEAGCSPADSLAVEDSPNGVRAARSAGLEVLWISEHAVSSEGVHALGSLKAIARFLGSPSWNR